MRNKIVLYALAGWMLVGCATQQQLTQSEGAESKPKQEQQIAPPHWHTCVTAKAKAVVTTPDQKVSATITMQAVHDSLIIVHIMPMMGIEMARIEATPTHIVGFDKVYHRYASMTYAELNSKITPAITWQTLEQIVAGELPTGKEEALLVYSLGKKQISARITYTEPQLNVPVHMTRLPQERYDEIDISRWF